MHQVVFWSILAYTILVTIIYGGGIIIAIKWRTVYEPLFRTGCIISAIILMLFSIYVSFFILEPQYSTCFDLLWVVYMFPIILCSNYTVKCLCMAINNNVIAKMNLGALDIKHTDTDDDASTSTTLETTSSFQSPVVTKIRKSYNHDSHSVSHSSEEKEIHSDRVVVVSSTEKSPHNTLNPKQKKNQSKELKQSTTLSEKHHRHKSKPYEGEEMKHTIVNGKRKKSSHDLITSGNKKLKDSNGNSAENKLDKSASFDARKDRSNLNASDIMSDILKIDAIRDRRAKPWETFLYDHRHWTQNKYTIRIFLSILLVGMIIPVILNVIVPQYRDTPWESCPTRMFFEYFILAFLGLLFATIFIITLVMVNKTSKKMLMRRHLKVIAFGWMITVLLFACSIIGINLISSESIWLLIPHISSVSTFLPPFYAEVIDPFVYELRSRKTLEKYAEISINIKSVKKLLNLSFHDFIIKDTQYDDDDDDDDVSGANDSSSEEKRREKKWKKKRKRQTRGGRGVVLYSKREQRRMARNYKKKTRTEFKQLRNGKDCVAQFIQESAEPIIKRHRIYFLKSLNFVYAVHRRMSKSSKHLAIHQVSDEQSSTHTDSSVLDSGEILDREKQSNNGRYKRSSKNTPPSPPQDKNNFKPKLGYGGCYLLWSEYYDAERIINQDSENDDDAESIERELEQQETEENNNNNNEDDIENNSEEDDIESANNQNQQTHTKDKYNSNDGGSGGIEKNKNLKKTEKKTDADEYETYENNVLGTLRLSMIASDTLEAIKQDSNNLSARETFQEDPAIAEELETEFLRIFERRVKILDQYILIPFKNSPYFINLARYVQQTQHRRKMRRLKKRLKCFSFQCNPC